MAVPLQIMFREVPMPLYSYRCTPCDHRFETLVRADDVPECPNCGGQALERLGSRTAPEPKSGQIIKSGRAAAAREGHFSNYSRAERSRG